MLPDRFRFHAFWGLPRTYIAFLFAPLRSCATSLLNVGHAAASYAGWMKTSIEAQAADGEDASRSTPSGPLLSEDSWKATKSRVATLDQNADTADLRWVGPEFVYFLDIPWDDTLEEYLQSPPPHSGQSDEDPSPISLSTRSLTIGLLEDLMDATIPEELLLSGDLPGARVISGSTLSRLVVPWFNELLARCTSPNEVDHPDPRWGQHNIDLLKRTAHALDQAVYSQQESILDDERKATLLCSLVTLFSCLEGCIFVIWQIGGPQGILDRTRMYDEVSQSLRQKFATWWGNDGSFELERWLSGSVAFSAYALELQRIPNYVRDVTSAYRPKHVIASCSCSFVRPSLDGIRAAVKNNEVPVVALHDNTLVVRDAKDTPYVAISHVWADGLGSTTEAGLPLCQVERLSGLANQLVAGGAFWQDGLCIPEEKEHRNLAIALMAETYARAHKVLVIDEGLRSACRISTPKEERLLRIATSGWMQRIWTLQEGMLARELHFVFHDGIVDSTHFSGSSYELAKRVVPMFNYRKEGDPAALTHETPSEEQPTCSVNDLIGLLRYRTTSKPRDEPVAVSGLLGIDTRALVQFDNLEERMRSLLIQCRVLPRQMAVFGWYTLRLPLPNFGWAPQSFSTMIWPEEPGDPHKAICTEDGLFGDFTVVRFSERITFPEAIGIILILSDTVGGGTIAPRDQLVYNLILSPYFFRVPEMGKRLTVEGFIMKLPALQDSMRDYGVGAVVFPEDAQAIAHPDTGRDTIACEWVAPASLRFGLPDPADTSRAGRYAWSVVYATVESMRCVRVI